MSTGRRFHVVSSNYGDICGCHVVADTAEEAKDHLRKLYPEIVDKGWDISAIDIDTLTWGRREEQAAWREGSHSMHYDQGPYCGPY